jgi:3-oxoacyl-[acyl-carrier protein] reductase
MPEMLTADLSPHLALVTGATGGIGKATCLALAALGCSVAVHYNSAADDAAELVRQLEAKGVRAQAFQADLGRYEDVCKLFVSGSDYFSSYASVVFATLTVLLPPSLEIRHAFSPSIYSPNHAHHQVRRLHSAVTSALGQPTILFNNAGSSLGKSGIKSITDITIDDFEQTWRTNCGTAFLLTQLCMPAMEEKGWGRVIFCSSVAGFTGGVVGPHYA